MYAIFTYKRVTFWGYIYIYVYYDIYIYIANIPAPLSIGDILYVLSTTNTWIFMDDLPKKSSWLLVGFVELTKLEIMVVITIGIIIWLVVYLPL